MKKEEVIIWNGNLFQCVGVEAYFLPANSRRKSKRAVTNQLSIIVITQVAVLIKVFLNMKS